MQRDELMKMAADKAVNELTWESIEYLFRPSNVYELLLRIDFEGTVKMTEDAMVDDSPAAMPWCFRREYYAPTNRAIKVERFYRQCKAAHEKAA